jgi:LysR family transcriptional regulator, low CO2-responsive transcriptional regulator
MTDSLNLENLRCFLIFSETLNFTRTAERLYISQPAVYVKVRELSETLAVPLYRKIGRRLELTEKGKEVARFARELELRINSFRSRLVTGLDCQPVVLAAGAGTYQYLIDETIREFTQKSKVPLKLITANRDGAIDAVQSGRAQLGIAALETLPDNCQGSLLFKVGQVLVMPHNHRLSKKRRIKLTDIEGCKLIVPPTESPYRAILSRLLQSAGVHWEIAVEAGGWELMLKFAELGLGLAIVNDFGHVPPGLIARPVDELPAVHYQLFHLRGELSDAGSLRLYELLLANARRSRQK